MLVQKQNAPPDPPNCVIILRGGAYALVDPEDYDRLARYNWFVKKSKYGYYAVRKVKRHGREFLVRMHRQIMHTPAGQVVHHRNGNRLDNRKSNLLNCNQQEHDQYHNKQPRK